MYIPLGGSDAPGPLVLMNKGFQHTSWWQLAGEAHMASEIHENNC